MVLLEQHILKKDYLKNKKTTKKIVKKYKKINH